MIKTVLMAILALAINNIFWLFVYLIKHTKTSITILDIYATFIHNLVYSIDVFIVIGAWVAYELYKQILLRYKMRRAGFFNR